MTDSNSETDESKLDAVRALLDPSQVMLHALAHGISPHAVRTRLIEHVAGVPPETRREPEPDTDIFVGMSSQEGRRYTSSGMQMFGIGASGSSGLSALSHGMMTPSTAAVAAAAAAAAASASPVGSAAPITLHMPSQNAGAAAATTTTAAARQLRLLEGDHETPIVAHVRRPRRRGRGVTATQAARRS